VSLALVTIELIARKNERKKQSKRKSSKEHNKSLSLITKPLCGIGRGFEHLGVSCIECLALVSSWKVENLDDLCWDHASSPKVLQKETALAEAACT
jgi:hypothetical protein